MTPTDLIRNGVRKTMLSDGYSERDSNLTAEDAVSRYRRNTKHQIAIKEAIAQGKKLYTKRGKK